MKVLGVKTELTERTRHEAVPNQKFENYYVEIVKSAYITVFGFKFHCTKRIVRSTLYQIPTFTTITLKGAPVLK